MDRRIWWIVTVVEGADKAAELARAAVAERLAACAQTGPTIQSYYHWEGRLQQAEEVRVVFKTDAARRRQLQEWLRARHPYAVPEILAWPAEEADPAYAAWVREA